MKVYFALKPSPLEPYKTVIAVNPNETPGKRIEDLTGFFEIKYIRKKEGKDSHYQFFEKGSEKLIMNVSLNGKVLEIFGNRETIIHTEIYKQEAEETVNKYKKKKKNNQK